MSYAAITSSQEEWSVNYVYVKPASIPVEISLSQGKKFSQKPSDEDCDWKDTT